MLEVNEEFEKNSAKSYESFLIKIMRNPKKIGEKSERKLREYYLMTSEITEKFNNI